MEKFNMVDFVKNLTDFRIVTIGKNGSGKTEFVRQLITAIQAYKKHKILIVDTKNEFKDKKRFNVLNLDLNTFIRKITQLSIGKEIIDNPSTITEYAGAIIWEFSPATLYVEEIEEFVDVNAHMPVSHKMIYKINQQGRARKACLITVCQQVNKLHKTFTNQASDVFLFAINKTELSDVEKRLKLDKGSFKFNMPTKAEIRKNELKDLYRFYHIENLQNPIFYERLPYKKRGRPPKKIEKK